MKQVTSDQFFSFLAEQGIGNAEAAALLNIDPRSLSTYKSRGLPANKLPLATRIVREYANGKLEPDQRISIGMTDDEFDLINRAALLTNTNLREFVLKSATNRARIEIEKDKQAPEKIA